MPTFPGYTTGAPYQTGTPSTQTAGGSTSSTSASGPGSAYYWLSLALQGASSYANYSSARQANRTNVSLQRDQLDWEERMANTAVQRRANDIEAAGGNRALAFTNGSEATTPTVAPAHVEPAQIAPLNLMSAKLMQAQLANINADTLDKTATARSKTVQANIDEAGETSKTEYTVRKQLEGTEQERLKTKIMANMYFTTSAQSKVAGATIDALITAANNQAKTGTLKLDALENIAKMGGIEAGMLAPIFKLILSAFVAVKD